MVIDKPQGFTSHACVSRLRRCYGLKRVGHGGTLDPAVTGVLPIALGQATRLLPYLPGEKTYTGLIQLGTTTDSDDLQGEVIKRQSHPNCAGATSMQHWTSFEERSNNAPHRFQRFMSMENGLRPSPTWRDNGHPRTHGDHPPAAADALGFEQRSAAVERALFSWDLHPRNRTGHRRTAGVGVVSHHYACHKALGFHIDQAQPIPEKDQKPPVSPVTPAGPRGMQADLK